MSELAFSCAFGNKLIPASDEALEVVKKLQPGQWLMLSPVERSTGTVPMLRTWRGWMRQTATRMAAGGCFMPLCFDADGNPHGRRPFNEYDAHELFTLKWLGADENGQRYSWAMRKTSNSDAVPAPRDRRLYAMDKHVAYCAERGIALTIPRNSEYWQLTQEQEK
jgi:hypothetical protein